MSEIREQVLGRLLCYGKLGLLIEDAPDAELRTAREIYGADGLPRWWLHFEDVQSSAEALRVVISAVLEGDPGWALNLPVVLVVDRYLKKAPLSTQVLPWDDPDKGIPEMCERMERLKPKPEMAIAKVTSYFNPGSTPQAIPWKPRNQEPLFQLRRSMSPELLAFGPIPGAPVRQGCSTAMKREEVAEAQCRSRLWDDALDGLTASFRPDSTCLRILFTGAGASFANHALAPGIPPTWFLLDWACWRVGTRKGLTARAEPTWPAKHAALNSQKEIRTVQELLDHFANGHSARDAQWSLERLFDDRSRNRYGLEELVNAFRQALQRYDHDFPYHTWLLAHLPWSMILTTNFDGFHERAAAAVASTLPNLDDAERVRRLGDVLEPTSITQGRRRVRRAGWIARASLFKPYGSLMRVGPLALSEGQFWDRIELFKHVLNQLLTQSREPVWLVILGQRLASEALTAMLQSWLKTHEDRAIHVVWVDPACCRIEGHPNANAYFLNHFRRVLEGDATEGRHRFYPLPAHALELAYDLWGRWWRRHRP